MRATHSGKNDIVIGAALLGFCGYAAIQTLEVRAVSSGTVAGPTFVPWLVICLVSILSITMIVRALLRMRSTTFQDTPVVLPERGTLVRMALFSLLMVVYAGAFMTVGYLPSTLVAFTVGLILFGERRLLVLVLLPISLTVVVYYSFTQFLGVWLP